MRLTGGAQHVKHLLKEELASELVALADLLFMEEFMCFVLSC